MSFGGAEHVVQINYEILYVLHSFVDWNLSSKLFFKDAGNKNSNLIQNVNSIAF